MKSNLLLLGLMVLLSCGGHSDSNSPINPRQQDLIKPIVKEAIDVRIAKGINASIVIGVLDSTGIDFYSKGLTATNGQIPDSHTLYEIGSITKVFTGLLLAEAMDSDRVNITDSVGKFVPEQIELSDSIASLNLKQLATHSAGLDRQSHNLRSEGYSATNPYAHYDEPLLFEELKSHQLLFAPGNESRYSNLGMSLLGHLIARSEKRDYATSLSQNILKPLGMQHTYTSMQGENIASGHTYSVPMENWDFKVLAGAGVLKSNAHDMLLFLSAQLGLTKTTLAQAIELSQQNHFTVDQNKAIGLAWGMYKLENGDTLYRHNGGTAGYRSFIGFLKNAKKGVIVLTNSSQTGVDDIGLHQLVDSLPLQTDFKRPVAQIVSRRLEEKESSPVAELGSRLETDTINTAWGELNLLGYTYLKKGENGKAIKVFELNTLLHPNSADGFDSLGEAYYSDGQFEKSLSLYKKALALDSTYNNAKRMIEKIEAELKKEANQKD